MTEENTVDVYDYFDDFEEEWNRKRAAAFFENGYCKKLTKGTMVFYLFLFKLNTGMSISEDRLAKLFDKSESTIRKYFEELINIGLIEKNTVDGNNIIYIGNAITSASNVKKAWEEIDKIL